MWGFVFLQVSITTEEVAECFPEQQEGSPEDWQKELCKDAAKESREVLGALGKRHPRGFQMCFIVFLGVLRPLDLRARADWS